MKTITLQNVQDHSDIIEQVCAVLEEGGGACLPMNGSYRLLADLNNTDAVMRLFQSKRRVKKAPSLVFLPDPGRLREVAADVSDTAAQLATQFWPGPLTILFEAHPDLPRKVKKQLTAGKKKIGVRVPDDELLSAIVNAFGRPIVVSSANRERKAGADSPAQVRKNFGRQIDLFVDAGDLQGRSSSTVVDIDAGELRMIRPGAIDVSVIQATLAQA